MNTPNSSLPTSAGLSAAVRQFTKIGAVACAALSIGAPLVHATGIVLDTNTLVIQPTGILDLKKNNLIVRSGDIGILTGYVTTGLYSGPNVYWDGYGINSSVAAVEGITAVGILNNAEYGYGLWPRAATIDANYNLLTDDPALNAHTLASGLEVLAKYTWLGDTDLNGVVDTFVDYGNFLLGFSDAVPASWLYGDSNYDGDVDDFIDYGNFILGLTGQTIPNGLIPQESLAAPVPEPTSGVLLAGGIIGLCARRHRKLKSEALSSK